MKPERTQCRLQDLRPINTGGDGTDILSDLWKTFQTSEITRRTLLMASPILAASTVALPAFGDKIKIDERISFHINPDRTSVTVRLWDAEKIGQTGGAEPVSNSDKANNNKSKPGEVQLWTLNKRAFGDNAQFALSPGGGDTRGFVTGTRARLTISNVVIGRNPAASIMFDFGRRGEGDAYRWYISARSSIWGHGPGNKPGSPSIIRLGEAKGTPLSQFLQGKLTLDGRMASSAVRASLARTFNGLLNVAPISKTHSGDMKNSLEAHNEKDESAFRHAEKKLSGKMSLRLSAALIWEISSTKEAVLRPVIPELAAQSVSIVRVVEHSTENKNDDVQILAIPTGISSARSYIPEQEISKAKPLSGHQGQIINLDDLHFHIHNSNANKKETDKTFVFEGQTGAARCCLRAFSSGVENDGNGSATKKKFLHAQAVIAGQWEITVRSDHDAMKGLIAGPITGLDGVVNRVWTVALKNQSDSPPPRNEVLTFAAAARIANDAEIGEPQEIDSPIGALTISGLPLGVSAKKPKNAKQSQKETFSTFVEEPFANYRGSPIWLKSRGTVFETGRDHERAVDWMEMKLMLHKSAIALPDASDSRLDFENTEVAFFHRREENTFLPRSFIRLEHLPHGVTPNSSGLPNPFDESSTMARIDMSGATIYAARHRDLVSLKFSFDKLFLKVDSKPRLVPETLVCGIHEYGPSRSATSHHTSADKRKDERLPVRDTKDTRPLLVVEFPPQHLFEEAFFLRSLPKSPDVDFSSFKDEAFLPFLKISQINSEIKAVPVAKRGTKGNDEKSVIAIIDIRSPDEIISLLGAISGASNRREIRQQIQRGKTGKDWLESASVTIPTPLKKQIEEFSDYSIDFLKKVEAAQLKFSSSFEIAEDQAVYIGPYAMDPDVAGIDRELRKKRETAFVTSILATAFHQVDDNYKRLLAKSQKENDDNIQLIGNPALQQAINKRRIGGTVSPAEILAVEAYLEASVPVYQLFRNFYRDEKLREASATGGSPGKNANEIEFLFLELIGNIDFKKNDWVLQQASYLAKPWLPTPESLTDTLKKFDSKISQHKGYDEHARGRLSSPSKLAFRINCRDGLLDARNAANEDGKFPPADTEKAFSEPFSNGVASIPFSLDGLTNWSAMELSVIKRAEQVFAAPPGGRLDQNSARKINLHGAAILDHLGFAPSQDRDDRTWNMRANKIVASLMDEPGWGHTSLEIPARLVLSPSQQAIFRAPSGVNPAIYEKDPVKAPSSGTYGTRAPAPSVFDERSVFPSSLWEARMMLGKDIPNPDLRAVYSPDLAQRAILKLYSRGEQHEGSKFPATGFGPPPRGPRAPWLSGSLRTAQADISPRDYAALINKHANNAALTEVLRTTTSANKNEVVCRTENGKLAFASSLPSKFADLCRAWLARKDNYEQFEFRSSLDAYDRHELVMLSSAFGLPVMPRTGTRTDTTTRQSSQFTPDNEYLLKDVMPEQEIYRPRTLNVTDLAMSSLGATFDHDTSFTPPASAKFENGKNLFDAFSIEHWQHSITFGRDVHCEVVYKGYLVPFGFKASLVKLTERIFAKSPSGRFKAYLRQRMFIRCADTAKIFGAIGQPFEGRRFPGRAVELLTDKTPDIVDPTSVYPEQRKGVEVYEHATGRLVFPNSSGLVFWPRTAMARSADVRFSVEIEKAFATCPMIFVDNTAANEPEVLRLLVDYYNNCLAGKNNKPNGSGVESPDVPYCFATEEEKRTYDKPKAINPVLHRRTLLLGGRKLRYADEKNSGSSSISTDAITLRLEGRKLASPALRGQTTASPFLEYHNSGFAFDAVLQGADQPPFYPALETTRIRLTQVAHLTGKPVEPVRAAYDGHYVVAGFPAVKEDEIADDPTTQPVRSKEPRGAEVPGEEEVFLNLIDGISQTMAKKGEQSGGIYRPAGVIKAISRSKGPIALNTSIKPAGLSKGQLPAFSTALDYPSTPKSKDSSNNSVSSNAKNGIGAKPGSYSFDPPNPNKMLDAIFGKTKLLGIIPFSDLIKFAGQLTLSNAPQLLETVEYGVAKVKGRANDLSETIRQDVLVPLANVMQRANGEWERLDTDLANRQKNRLANVVNFQPFTLSELFPEIDVALEAFSAILVTASQETDSAKLLSLLGPVYESGQQFLDSLRRAASNPVERFEDKLQNRFNGIRDKIDGLRNLVGGQLEVLLDAIKSRAAEEIVNLLFPEGNQNPDNAHRVIFALPLPATSVLLLSDTQRVILNDTTAIKQQDVKRIVIPFVNALIDGQNPFENNDFQTAAKEVLEEKKTAALMAFDDALAGVESRLRARIMDEITNAAEILTLLTENVEYVINDKIDALIDKAEKKLKLPISEFLIVYEEVQAIVHHVTQTKMLWEQLETALSKQRLGDSIDAAQVLASHVTGQNITLVPPEITLATNSVKLVLLSTLKGLSFNKLGVIELTAPLVDKCEITEEIRALNTDIVKLLPADKGGIFVGKIATWHAEVVSANKELTGDKRDKIEQELGKLPANLQPIVDSSLKGADMIMKTSHNTLASLFCDIMNDSELLRGMEQRRLRIVVAIENSNVPIQKTIEDLTALRSDLKRLLASRKLVVKRTFDNIEKLMNGLALFFTSGGTEIVLFAGLAVLTKQALKTLGVDQSEIFDALISLANPVNKGISSIIDAAIWVLNNLAVIVGELETFAKGIAKSTDPTIRLIKLDEFTTEKPSKIANIKKHITNLGDLLKDPRLTPPSLTADTPENTVNELQIFYSSLAELAETGFAKEITASVEKVDTSVRTDLRKCLDLTKLAERATKSILTEFELKLFKAADARTSELLARTKVSDLYGELEQARLEILDHGVGEKIFGDLLLLPPDPARVRATIPGSYTRPVNGGVLTSRNDRLAADTAWLAHATTGNPVSNVKQRAYLGQFIKEWSREDSTPLLLINGLGERVRALLKGDVDLLELFQVRQQVEAYLLNLIPSKHKFDLDVNFPLPKQVANVTGGIFVPGDDCELRVGAATEINLLPEGIKTGAKLAPPKVTSKAVATLGSFEIKLVGDFFDAVTMQFAGARFESDFSNSDLKLYFLDVIIGDQLKFIQDLQSLMSPSEGSGVFIKPLRGMPGIEAGYGLNLGSFMIGNVAFGNISLNASTVLPFNGGENSRALFKASLSRSDAPFTIAYIPFGGSGYFEITADANGIVGFEMSLEFGAAAPFKIGPLTGIGRIMAGFFIRTMKLSDNGPRVTEIYATFFAGGSASIWIFSFSASLYVRLGMEQSGAMLGLAIFSFSFSMGFADFDYSIRFEKREDKGFEGGGDQEATPKRQARFGSPGSRYTEHKGSFIKVAGDVPPGSIIDGSINRSPEIVNLTKCQSCDWAVYTSYFDTSIEF